MNLKMSVGRDVYFSLACRFTNPSVLNRVVLILIAYYTAVIPNSKNRMHIVTQVQKSNTGPAILVSTTASSDHVLKMHMTQSSNLKSSQP